jgi:hypothetical protein
MNDPGTGQPVAPASRESTRGRLGSRDARPSYRALQDRQLAEAWRVVALGACLSALVLSFLIVRAGRSEERVFVLDPAGNVLAGPSESMAESKGFFTLTALYCANTALQRSSEGFDLYELLRLYYTPRAVQKLEEDWQAKRDDAAARNLQQKPLVDSIGDPVRAGAKRIVEVRGRIVSAGAYAGRSFYDELPFVLVLTLRRNPDLGKAGSYPWLCEDFDLTLKEALK